MSSKLKLFSAMSELGAGTRGASLGLQALKFASLKYDPQFFMEREEQKIETENEMLFEKTPNQFAKRVDGVARMYQRITAALGKDLPDHKAVIFTGDHSNAGGTIAGIKKAFPDKRLGVIWVDAHADLHSPFTSPTGNIHGMPLATALGEDNLECKNNEPLESTLNQWSIMKGNKPKILYSDLFFIAVRSTEAPENAIMERHNLPNITVDQLREMGAVTAAEKALNYLSDCDLIYVSFDVDSMDPSVSRGTGTPVDHGLSPEEASDLLLHFVDDPRLCCLEVTEINPLLDLNGNSMAETAFQIIKPVIEKFESNII